MIKTSIRRIIKNKQFHPFKIQQLQELDENDYNKSVEVCQWFQNFYELVPKQNRHGFHYYSDVNRHALRYRLGDGDRRRLPIPYRITF